MAISIAERSPRRLAHEIWGNLSTSGNRIGVVGFPTVVWRLGWQWMIEFVWLSGLIIVASRLIFIYGSCFQKLGTKKTNGAPLLTLRGSEDASNDLEACAERENELKSLGVAVEAIVYDGAGHAWENTQPQFFSEQSLYIEGWEWSYDEKGVPLVDGERLVDYEQNATRAERNRARLRLGARLSDCVKYGYLIGRDEKTRR